MPNLVGILPRAEKQWPENIFSNITLADPSFATPNNVDIMLGNSVYTHVIKPGVLKEEGYVF